MLGSQAVRLANTKVVMLKSAIRQVPRMWLNTASLKRQSGSALGQAQVFPQSLEVLGMLAVAEQLLAAATVHCL